MTIRFAELLCNRAAVVAWLGYRTPHMVGPQALTPGSADEAAPELRRFVGELGAAKPASRICVLCHSFGTVVCARAARGLRAAGIVLYGSPGTGADSVAGLHTRATVWAGRTGAPGRMPSPGSNIYRDPTNPGHPTPSITTPDRPQPPCESGE